MSSGFAIRGRLRAVVRGRVQGVSYRWSTVEKAEQLGLTGWVRNLPDGSVELEAQGVRVDLEALIAWCREGPPGARVTGVSVEWTAEIAGESGFKIRS